MEEHDFFVVVLHNQMVRQIAGPLHLDPRDFLEIGRRKDFRQLDSFSGLRLGCKSLSYCVGQALVTIPADDVPRREEVRQRVNGN